MAGFEGPEKHLELDFRPRSWKTPVESGLLGVADADWAPVLAAAKVHVLSVVASEHVRMFLLSESSMIVMKTRVIIKTCGTTTLLNAIESIIAVALSLQLDLSFIAFHRRDYLFPDAQPYPHRDFVDESEFLRGLFPMGRAHVFGEDGGPRSYLWMATVPRGHSTAQTSSPTSDQASTPTTPAGSALGPWDAPGAGRSATLTLEVMMTDIDPEVLNKFHRNPDLGASKLATPAFPVTDVLEDAALVEELRAHPSNVFFSEPLDEIKASRELGARVTMDAGIDTLIPGSAIDAYQFTPCGYSMNGVADSQYYWTIHITPESHCNFISFESSLPVQQHTDMVSRVLRLFRPKSAIVRVLSDRSHAPASFDDLLADTTGYQKLSATEFEGGRNAIVLFASLVKEATDDSADAARPPCCCAHGGSECCSAKTHNAPSVDAPPVTVAECASER